MACPLYNVTKKVNRWKWGEKENKAFDHLRTKLTSAPVLVHFDSDKPIVIKTDVSNYMCAGILSQLGETGEIRLVAYRSKTMTKAEVNYDVHDKELLAIV